LPCRSPRTDSGYPMPVSLVPRLRSIGKSRLIRDQALCSLTNRYEFHYVTRYSHIRQSRNKLSPPSWHRIPIPWEIQVIPIPWETHGIPILWETHKIPIPWETHRIPIPWEAHRTPIPWEIQGIPIPWEIQGILIPPEFHRIPPKTPDTQDSGQFPLQTQSVNAHLGGNPMFMHKVG
jgi:hypothetical protein